MSSVGVSIEELVGRVEKLEEENERKDDLIEEQQNRIDELESRLELRGEKKEMENLWIYGLPVGKMLENRKQKVKSIDKRVTDIEAGEVDPGQMVANSDAGLDPSELLPLHQMFLSGKKLEPEDHNLHNNQEIAARLFPYLGKYSHSHEGKMVLPSTKVRDIIEREISNPELAKRLDVEEPNANTVRRAMKHAAKFGKDLIKFDTESKKTNQLIIDRDAWVEYTQQFSDDVVAGGDYGTVNTADDAVEEGNMAEEGVDEEFDRLTEEVITVS